MGSIPLKELRRNLGRVMRSRKPVIVTRRGKPVARIIPFGAPAGSRSVYDLLKECSGIIDDPRIPADASARLNDIVYGPVRSRR